MAAKRPNRLSVAQCDPVGKADTSPVGLEYTELVNNLQTQHTGNKVVSLKSRTDQDRQRRRSFAEKDHSSPEGASGEQTPLAYVNAKGIGINCRKGMKPEAPNQDSFALLQVEDVFALYGVFDGHGPFGHDVSDRARDLLVIEFTKHPERDTNTTKAFEESFVRTQEILKQQFKSTEVAVSGSTCTMAYHNIAANTVTVAHIGDSRCVLGIQGAAGTYSRTEALTVDHKPEIPAEKVRIEAKGGRVEFDGFYNYRVFAKGSQSPGLNMSRAFGDVYAHTSAGLTAMPEVKEIKLTDYKEECLSLIICSDGVWEFIESENATKIFDNQFVSGKLNVQEAANALAAESYKRWMDDSGQEVADDITVMLIEIPLKA